MAGRIAGKAAVSLRDFLTVIVKAHDNGQNQTWVAGQLGCSPAAVSLRLKGLKSRGVRVPELTANRSSNVAGDAMDILAELGIEQHCWTDAAEWTDTK